jgi:hypothetical protein
VYSLRLLVYEIESIVKWGEVSDDQTRDASWLQYVFETNPIHFKADSGVPQGILSNTVFIGVVFCNDICGCPGKGSF